MAFRKQGYQSQPDGIAAAPDHTAQGILQFLQVLPELRRECQRGGDGNSGRGIDRP
jgi:hypothetical protein